MTGPELTLAKISGLVDELKACNRGLSGLGYDVDNWLRDHPNVTVCLPIHAITQAVDHLTGYLSIGHPVQAHLLVPDGEIWLIENLSPIEMFNRGPSILRITLQEGDSTPSREGQPA